MSHDSARRPGYGRLFLGLLVVTFLFIALHRARFPVSAAEGNILKNGDFEESGKDPVPGWVIEPKTAHQGTISLVSDPVHSGKHSLKLAPNRSNGSDALRVGQGFPADSVRGRKVYVSGWMAAEGQATAVIGLLVLRSNGAVSSVQLRHDASKPGFVLHQDVLAVPDLGDVKYLIAGCSVEGASGAAYFDDVYVGTSPPPQAQAAAKTDQRNVGNATIAVDATRELRQIPAGVFGTNVEWIWDANGLWDSRAQRLDPEMVSLTRDLGVSLLRFPGGVFSNYYHWKDSIGPISSRREAEHTPGGPRSMQYFGTDEALEFARQTGTELLITVNAETGTPEEAAEWVRYVNVEKKAHVRYWEVGNELYNNAAVKPDQYADRFRRFAKAMRAVDPTIQVGAIGPDNYPRIFSGNRWTEQVLSRAGGEIDFFSVHNGYAPVLPTDQGFGVRDVYAAMLAAPKLVEANLNDVARKLQQEPSTRGRDIKIAVTEWGPLFQGTAKDRFVDHTKTLGSGLYTASLMKVLLENPHVEVANFFKLVDPLFAGFIGLRGGRPIPKAPYLAFQMYTHHFGRVLLGSSTVSPTYDSLSVGWVDAVKDVPYLETVASRSEDGRTLYLIVINKNFDQEIAAKIDLRGFSPASEGKVWTLTGPSIDANTGTELFQAPGVKWTQQAQDEKNPRFAKGDPSEVRIVPSRVANVGSTFQYTFPPRSVTALEIAGQKERPARH